MRCERGNIHGVGERKNRSSIVYRLQIEEIYLFADSKFCISFTLRDKKADRADKGSRRDVESHRAGPQMQRRAAEATSSRAAGGSVAGSVDGWVGEN